MKTTPIRWRRVPGALLAATWRLSNRRPLAFLAAATLTGVCALMLALGAVGVVPGPAQRVQSASITPITSASDSASGIVVAASAYEVRCTVTGAVTLYPAVHNGSAWTIYRDRDACTLSGTGAGSACVFPARRGAGLLWNVFKTGDGSVASCTAQETSMPVARRRGGGGGGSCPECPERMAPDSDDVVVWYNYPGGSAWNAAVGGTDNNLTIVSTSGPFRALGVFGDAMFAPSPFLDTSTGGVGYGSITTVGEGNAYSASAWIYVQQVPGSTPGVWPVVLKQDVDGSWTGPSYASWHLSLIPGTGAAGTADLHAGIWLVGGVGVVPQASGVTAGLHHVGLTVNTSYAKLYLDGVLADTRTTGAATDWFSHGPYQVGGLRLTAYTRGWSAQSVGDVRIAQVARDATYFSTIYATRRIAMLSALAPKHPVVAAPVEERHGALADNITWAKAQLAAVRRNAWPAAALNVRWTGTTWIYAGGPIPGGRWKPSAADESATDWVRA